ncbi:MAG: hypothetical protein FWF97_02490 [Alphaproteobacteria bacterium]|nr:hypothetical protein [Alphaproteobacteria bacterium]
MNHDYESLKADVKSWYPDRNFTDDELNEMTDRLIEFFAIGAEAMQLLSVTETSFQNAPKHPENSRSVKNSRLQVQPKGV